METRAHLIFIMQILTLPVNFANKINLEQLFFLILLLMGSKVFLKFFLDLPFDSKQKLVLNC